MTHIPPSSLPFLQKRRDQLALLKTATPVIFIVLSAVFFHEFIVQAILGHLAVNVCIIAGSSYGILLIFARLLSAQKDMRALERFSQEAQSGSDMNELLDQPWVKHLSIRQYLEPIAQTEGTLASQLDQNAIENELEALSDEYNSKMELPQFLVGFMVAMGLLGTFIGLLETLTGISGMLDDMGKSSANIEEQFSNLVVELRKPLAGMGMAFSASMFGLVASLMLSIMMIALRRYINLVLSKARCVMHELTTRIVIPVNQFLQQPSAPAPQPVIAQSEYADYRPVSEGHAVSSSQDGEHVSIGMREIMAHTNNAIIQISESVNAMIDRVDRLAEKQEGHDRIATNLDALISRMGGLLQTRDSEEKTVNTVVKLIDRINVMIEAREAEIAANTTGSSQSLLQATGEDAVVPRLLASLKTLSSAQTEQQKIGERMIESLTEIDQKFMAMLAGSTAQRTHNEEVVNLTRDLARKIDEAATALRSIGDSALSLTPALDRKLTPVTNTAREALIVQQQSASKLDEIYNANQDSSRHLMEIKEGFIKSISSFSQVDTIAENTGRQALLLETSLEETRNAQKALVSTFQRELREFTRELAQVMGVTLHSSSEA